jgi:hypothetical protein
MNLDDLINMLTEIRDISGVPGDTPVSFTPVYDWPFSRFPVTGATFCDAGLNLTDEEVS